MLSTGDLLLCEEICYRILTVPRVALKMTTELTLESSFPCFITYNFYYLLHYLIIPRVLPNLIITQTFAFIFVGHPEQSQASQCKLAGFPLLDSFLVPVAAQDVKCGSQKLKIIIKCLIIDRHQWIVNITVPI
jgi:hypothetical protein